MKLSTWSVLLVTSLLFQQSAVAANFRCGPELITSGLRIGITQYEVAKSCGKPVAMKGNRWIYDRPGEKVRILVFDEVGQLIAIHKR